MALKAGRPNSQIYPADVDLKKQSKRLRRAQNAVMNTKYLRATKRRLLEFFGNDSKSWPALNGLDRKLVEFLARKKGGFFVEVGGNDGYTQSNTYYLERFLNWKGILVEPIPRLYRECKRERFGSTVFNYALVGDSLATPFIELHDADLMSVVQDDKGHIGDPAQHAKIGREHCHLPGEGVTRVAAKTLTEVLEMGGAPPDFDLLSLDVEGYEIEVLKGLDLARYKPRIVLVEERHGQGIEAILSSHYALAGVLNATAEYRDALFCVREG